MKRNVLTFLVLIPLWCSAQTTVAIGDFQNRTRRFFLDSWEQKIPEFLHSELSRSRKLILVERNSLKALLDEQALSMTGLVDSTAQSIGKMLSAQYVITGTIHFTGKRIRIDARMIQVESGKVVTEKVTGLTEDHLEKMIDLLANNIQYQLSGAGAYQNRVILKKYPTTYFALGTLGCAVATILVNGAFQQKQDTYQNASHLSEFDSAYDAANRLYKIRNGLAYATGFALATTLYCLIRNLNPEEIVATGPPVVPYFYSMNNGEFRAGLQITF